VARRGRRRAAGDLESQVLAELWAADRPLTPGETAVLSRFVGAMTPDEERMLLRLLDEREQNDS
jgi:hypothetical protein